MSTITFSQVMQGYLLAIGARHLSEHTVKDYINTFNKFTTYLGEDIPLEVVVDVPPPEIFSEEEAALTSSIYQASKENQSHDTIFLC